jgi:hypothetical protein
MDILEHLVDAPIANIFIVAGLIFLGIAAVGKIMGKIEPDRMGRIVCGLLGLTLLVGGAYAHVQKDSSRKAEGGSSQQKTQTIYNSKNVGSSITEDKVKRSESSVREDHHNSH